MLDKNGVIFENDGKSRHHRNNSLQKWSHIEKCQYFSISLNVYFRWDGSFECPYFWWEREREREREVVGLLLYSCFSVCLAYVPILCLFLQLTWFVLNSWLLHFMAIPTCFRRPFLTPAFSQGSWLILRDVRPEFWFWFTGNFFRFRVGGGGGGTKKINIKALKMTS